MSGSEDRLGEILAAHRLGRDALVLFGWSGAAYSANGAAVTVKRPQGKGRFAAASWFDEELKRHWFLIVVHAPEAGVCQAGDGFHLHGSGAGTSTVAYCPPSILDADAFTGELLGKLGARTSDAVGFLMTLFAVTSASTPEPVRALISAALNAAAEEHGVVEIVGRVEDQGLLLQGWIRDPRTAEPRLLIDSGSLQGYGATFATFARSDLAAPALGFVAVVHLNDGDTMAAPRQIYIKSGECYRRLTVLPNAIHLRDEDVQQHLAGLLANLRTDPASHRVFQAASRPRFTGRETVSSLPVPVRMAVDLAARMVGAGWYVTGWLLDPMRLVSSVVLRGSGGLSERVDATWTRLPREDVSNGFRGEALFDGRIAHDMHGFTAFVPADTDETTVCIELDVANRGTAFMPVAITPIDNLEDRKRLLLSVDLHKSSASDIIERQLGPLFHARPQSARQPRAYRAVRGGGQGGHAALILPVVEDDIKSKIVVAHLASSRLPRGTRTVFVCSPSSSEAIRRLPRDLDFYGLAGDILIAEQPVDRCEAIEIGVAATSEARLVFLAPQVHGLSGQWLAELIAGLGEGAQPIAICPTLLYEDGSIRYAGIDSVEFSDAPPYATAVCLRAGYPRGAVSRESGGPTFAGVLDCCAMTRTAFDAVGGFGAGYALDAFKGLDLFLRLRAAGVPLIWTGHSEVYALDDLHGASQYWAAVGALVDGWAFKSAWQAGLSPRDARRADEPVAGVVGPAISLADIPRTRLRAVAG